MPPESRHQDQCHSDDEPPGGTCTCDPRNRHRRSMRHCNSVHGISQCKLVLGSLRFSRMDLCSGTYEIAQDGAAERRKSRRDCVAFRLRYRAMDRSVGNTDSGPRRTNT